MRLIKGVNQLNETLTGSVVTIGNFDGVHLGHQKIIGLAVNRAQGRCIAYTFRPHPQIALNPDRNFELLSTYEERLELFAKLGVNCTIEEPFSRAFSGFEPEYFFNEILVRKLGAKCVIIGYDFGFGKNRDGHLSVLKELCARSEVELVVVPQFSLDEEVVSSSKIRGHLKSGEIQRANRLLGRAFSYRGIVVHGDRRGGQIGFPTANLGKLENKLTLPHGVYATRSKVGDHVYSSVTNIGVRPTFKDATSHPGLVETHLLDETTDLYGRTLEVSFVARIREERRFSGVSELKTQITIDIEKCRELLRSTETVLSAAAAATVLAD